MDGAARDNGTAEEGISGRRDERVGGPAPGIDRHELNRRRFLIFLGGSAAVAAIAPPSVRADDRLRELVGGGLPLKGITPVRLPHPLPIYTEQKSFLATGLNGAGRKLGPDASPELLEYTVIDDVVVSPEYEPYVIAAFGDRVFPNPHDYVGHNHDYTGFVPVDDDDKEQGLLWINHEYVGWPFHKEAPGVPADIRNANPAFRAYFEEIVGFALPLDRTTPAGNRELLGEFHYNMGGSIVLIRRGKDGRFTVKSKNALNRRIHALSGLAVNAERGDAYRTVVSWGARPHQRGDGNYLLGTGPAAADVFEGVNADGLGRKIIGTGFNCSGATTPWGTIMSAEENFQADASLFYVGVQEQVRPDGSQLEYITGTSGAEFGLVGEKYGWMVEIPVKHPQARAKKHTALGRFRHENVAMVAERGHPLVVYMGDDRRGGHTYKYVSKGKVRRPDDPRNSDLLAEGTLCVAYFAAAETARNGTGHWIPLTLDTDTDPNDPRELSSVEAALRGGAVQNNGNTRLPRRSGIAGQAVDGGSFVVTLANAATALPDYQGKKLGDFYPTQGAILCDVFHAANLAGGTPGARPEDIEVHPRTGEVFIAFTDGEPGGDGYPDSRIFVVTKYTAGATDTQPFGGLYKIKEDDRYATDGTFRWEVFSHGGEAGADDGMGFASADNLAFDDDGTLWVVTDMSTERHNGFNIGAAGAPRANGDHAQTTNADEFVRVFGNNWLFAVPTKGRDAGRIIPVAYGPVRSEMTGPTFVDDTLIISVQHPSEDVPIGDGTTLSQPIEILKLDGSGVFSQSRTVPRGSNWPSNALGDPDGPPKPATIGIQPAKRRGRDVADGRDHDRDRDRKHDRDHDRDRKHERDRKHDRDRDDHRGRDRRG